MGASVSKTELVQRVAARLGQDPVFVGQVVDATLEEIYSALKREKSISLIHFGTFYIRRERDKAVFKFNPSQRLRALFGWYSTYRGKV